MINSDLVQVRVEHLLDNDCFFDSLSKTKMKEEKLQAEYRDSFTADQWDQVLSLIDMREDYLMEFAFIVYRTAFRDALEIVGCK